MGGNFHAPISGLTQVLRGGDVACVGGDPGERVEGEDFDVGVVLASGIVEDRDETFLGPGDVILSVDGGQQAFAERSLLATSGGDVPRGCLFECCPGAFDLSEGAEDAPEMHSGERGQADITGCLGLVDRELKGGGTSGIVTRLALRSSEAGELVRLGLLKAKSSRCLRGATEVDDGIVEPELDAGQLTEHRVAADVEPRVLDCSQPVLDLIDSFDAALLVTG